MAGYSLIWAKYCRCVRPQRCLVYFSPFWSEIRSILAIMVANGLGFLYSSLELGMIFGRRYSFITIDNTTKKSTSPCP